MLRQIQGRYVHCTTHNTPFDAYIPHPLPPNPPLNLDFLWDLVEQANRALGRLDGLGRQLPEINLLIYMYVRKEAVLSSQIEGTQSSLSDLLLYENVEAPGVTLEDVREVSGYVRALEWGWRRIQSDGMPLSLRLIREVHAELLATGRGSQSRPGEFRTNQNWIGGSEPARAIYVPPPPEELGMCLYNLEAFLNDLPARTPTLMKAALAHVQFESIHPFLDGNGRLGRLLITLILCAEKALMSPILYLSLYFKQHRAQYYELLQQVRLEGDWEAWLEFFLRGTIATADLAISAADRTIELLTGDRQTIGTWGRIAGSALQVHLALSQKPICTIEDLSDRVNLSRPTVSKTLELLTQAGMLRELTGRQRDRIFVYDRYLSILNEGTEAL
ncbi:Fic family protein [Merismopedia glauca]|uniref:Cell filamentation protein Fic n=1 Tax=Merismopedia glauca CCAP 1448/3 TaxID=1296344 RepID=A0A2T1C095_9CYAN|nr:Fic family protein [Merismopedia glauca]PSB01543.1 cell filamentation protein Fic [Merismopedia glauca CCAP 1448/3]